jgi:hypothetical protein
VAGLHTPRPSLQETGCAGWHVTLFLAQRSAGYKSAAAAATKLRDFDLQAALFGDAGDTMACPDGCLYRIAGARVKGKAVATVRLASTTVLHAVSHTSTRLLNNV